MRLILKGSKQWYHTSMDEHVVVAFALRQYSMYIIFFHDCGCRPQETQQSIEGTLAMAFAAGVSFRGRQVGGQTERNASYRGR